MKKDQEKQEITVSFLGLILRLGWNGTSHFVRHDIAVELVSEEVIRALGDHMNLDYALLERINILPKKVEIEVKHDLINPRLRSLDFVVPEGAPFELVEGAVEYAEKFIPQMIRENMAALETRIRKTEVNKLNAWWAEFSDRFANGINRERDQEVDQG